jgi:DNA-binding protein H-NS
MSKIVADFKALSLDAQLQAFSQITAAFTAAKDAKRQELEAQIRALGFKPGEGKKAPTAAVKFRSKSDPARGWAGRGAEPTWLKKEKEETGLPLNAFKVESEKAEPQKATPGKSGPEFLKSPVG